MRFALCVSVLASLGLALVGTAGAVTSFSAHMVGDREVPPNNSGGSADALFVLDDSNDFSYIIDLLGALSSPETTCRIHGPAHAGETAPLLYSLPLGSHKEGSVGTLSDPEIAQLMDGLWYCNLSTQIYPTGEIRCQILNVVDTAPTTWGAVKRLYW
jgi:hypothetical protein